MEIGSMIIEDNELFWNDVIQDSQLCPFGLVCRDTQRLTI